MPDVFMPRLSDTMTEGVLVRWLKQEGDQVRIGDMLAEIETDKATMELEAYDSGVLTRIIVQPGTTVPIGKPIAVIGEERAAAADKKNAHPEGAEVAAEKVSPDPAAAPGPSQPEPEPAPPAAAPATDPSSDRSRASIPMSPLVRSLARKHKLDLTGITGTGPGGRIVRADVEDAIEAQSKDSSDTAPSTPPVAVPSSTETVTTTDEHLPLSSIRRITAQRLTESASAPHFYLTSVADAEPLLRLRSEVNAELGDTAARISVTDLLIRACAVALRTHPQVNSSWGGDHLVRRGHINVGCAVALDDGLIVPVVRDADRKSLTEIAAEAHRLTDRARAGRLTPDEFSGGTFTISNLGMYGIDHFTAVINPPEAAILAVGSAQPEAVVRDGRVVVATTMKLTLSIDHRVLDGATAAAFLRDLVELFEHPLRILA